MGNSRRILFARIGQMRHYAGPQSGDEKPIGGGEHNRDKLGHEAFNFLNVQGRLYGFIQRRVNLLKIDPHLSKNATKIGGVTVIFIAPYADGQRVVGWYKDAVVYGNPRAYPSRVKRTIHSLMKKATKYERERATFNHYWVEVSAEDAVLLPTHVRLRRSPVPRREKGGFGQWNVSYAYESVGVLKTEQWIDQAIAFVCNYKGANLLVEPEAEAATEDALLEQQERAAGFQSDPIIRRAVEAYAMKRAKAELIRRGYHSFDDTSNRESYDYTCKKAGKLHFVEVKGTQLAGTTAILTKNEVTHAQENPDASMIVIVHHVNVQKGSPPIVTRGRIDIHERWRPSRKDLVALHYKWNVPRG